MTEVRLGGEVALDVPDSSRLPDGLGVSIHLAGIIRESRSTGFQPVSGEDRQDACPTRVPYE